MEHFIINPTDTISRNSQSGIKTAQKLFLRTPIDAFYHADYVGGGNWRKQGTIENMICTFKNDITPYSDKTLKDAQVHLMIILLLDLPKIREFLDLSPITVCVIPRAKKEKAYGENQKLFRRTVQVVAHRLDGFVDGTHFIIRHTDTKTTHLSRHGGDGGDGDMPYPGITKNTCTISDEVIGRNILLIDDLYTKTVGVDEDAIQALLDKGAKSVFFYSVGKTISR